MQREASANLMRMDVPQILDVMEGFKQRPETLNQLKQLAANVAIEHAEPLYPLDMAKRARKGVVGAIKVNQKGGIKVLIQQADGPAVTKEK